MTPLGWSVTPTSVVEGASNVKDENTMATWRGLGRRMVESQLEGLFCEIDYCDGGILSLSCAMLLESLTCHSLMGCGKFSMPQPERTGAAVPSHSRDLGAFPS